MQTSKNDVWEGLFVLIGAAAILFLALQSANLLSLNFEKTYHVVGRFDNVGGVKPKAAVRSAGVLVGRVESISCSRATPSPRTARSRFSPAVCWVSSTSASSPVATSATSLKAM